MFALPRVALSQNDIPWRVQTSVYGLGLFSTSIYHMSNVVVPLYAITLDPSPVTLGLVLSARHFLPLVFSIHAGALMDRIGARRVMIVVTLLGVAVQLLFPAMPWLGALIALQLVAGFSDLMGWLGAQTMVGQYMSGRTSYAGRLSSIIRIGHFFGPPMAGAAWDAAGAWGAFGMIALWGLGSVSCALLLPKPKDGAYDAASPEHRRVRPGDLLPNADDYLATFRMLAIPAAAVVVLLGSMLHVGNAVQGAFYIVWLKHIGIAGTAIGTLISVGAVGAGLFSLLTTRLVRYVPGIWVLLLSMWVAILFICATPLFGSYGLLVAAMFARSGAIGLGQPLTITLMLRDAGTASQGKAVGLRGTVNRIASIAAPLGMGALVEAVGLERSFYAIAVLVSILIAAVGLYLLRRPELVRATEESCV